MSARSTQSTIAAAPDVQSLPYLLLDIRRTDEFEQCHIIGGMIYGIIKEQTSVVYSLQLKQHCYHDPKQSNVPVMYSILQLYVLPFQH